MMNAASPEGSPPRRFLVSENPHKISCPAVPWRGPEADCHRKFSSLSRKYRRITIENGIVMVMLKKSPAHRLSNRMHFLSTNHVSIIGEYFPDTAGKIRIHLTKIISKRLRARYSQQELRHAYLLRIQVFQFITE